VGRDDAASDRGSFLEIFQGSDHLGALEVSGRVRGFQIVDSPLLVMVDSMEPDADGLHPRRFDWYRITRGSIVPNRVGTLPQGFEVSQVFQPSGRSLVADERRPPEERHWNVFDGDFEPSVPGGLEVEVGQVRHQIDPARRLPELNDSVRPAEIIGRDVQRVEWSTEARERIPDAVDVPVRAFDPHIDVTGCAGHTMHRHGVRPDHEEARLRRNQRGQQIPKILVHVTGRELDRPLTMRTCMSFRR
jgi:hypothetical protein